MLTKWGLIVSLMLILLNSACSEKTPAVSEPSMAQRQEAQVLNNRAALFLRQQRLQRALTILKQALELDPNLGQAHFNIGLVQARLGEHVAAIKSFEKALKLTPQVADLLFALGVSLRSQHRYLEAAGRFQEAIALVPDKAAYHFHLGEVQRSASDFAAAIDAFEATIRLDSTHLEALYYYGDLLARDDQTDKAKMAWRRLLQIQPQAVPTLLGLGGVYLKEQDAAQAVALFQRAIQAEPRHTQAHYLLSQAYRQAGQEVLGDTALKQFQRLSTAQKHFEQGNLYAYRGELTAAIESFNLAVQVDTAFVAAYVRLGMAHLRADSKAQALVNAKQAVSQAHEGDLALIEALCLVGDVSLSMANAEAAKQAFAQAIETDYSSERAHFGLARSHYQLYEQNEALDEFDLTLKLNPDQREAYYYRGLIFMTQQRLQDAVLSFQQCIKIDPKYAPAHYAVGRLLVQQRDYSGAAKAYKKALDLGHPKAKEQLAALAPHVKTVP